MKKTKEILAELAVFKKFCIYFFSFKGCFPRSAFWGGFLFAHAVRSTLDFAGYMCSSLKLRGHRLVWIFLCCVKHI